MSRSFANDQNGGVAPMVGLALTMMVIASGAAVDYSYATNKRHDLQKTVDSAVLAAAAIPTASDQERMDRATEMFEASKFCETYQCDSPAVSMDNGAIVVSGTAMVETSLLQVAGLDTVEIAVTARAVPLVENPVDVVMILDYSGSMNGANKFQDMAAAATQFLDSAEAQPGDNMAVGIVPFSRYVLSPMQGRYLFDVSMGNDLTGQNVVGCILNREHPYSTNVAAPVTSTPGSLWPVFSYTVGSAPGSGTYSDMPVPPNAYTSATWTYNNPDTGEVLTYDIDLYDNDPGSTVNGVTAQWRMPDYTGMDFDGGGRFHLVYKGSPSGHPGSVINLGPPPTVDPFATFGGYGGSTGWTVGDDSGLPTVYDQNLLAENLAGDCSQYATNSLWVRTLGKDFGQLKTAVAGMRPIGLTNIALGLDVGWHALTPEAPFIEATTDANKTVSKIAILLTDGVQTVSAHGAGGAVSIASANANITESCDAMKTDGIEVFTIAFDIQDAYTRSLLENCASGAPYYFEPSAGGDLDAVFESIFNKIITGQVRLTG